MTSVKVTPWKESYDNLAFGQPRLGYWKMEEEMATHSSILAWKIPWTEEPGWVQPVGSQRVGHA